MVATPLGHLRDLTLRALDVLIAVDSIFAEDTRVTGVLLARYGIATRPIALHAHNEARRAEQVIATLAAGRSAALVTDAGTPAVSDPGARLVRAVRDAGHRVVPIPGPSAVATAVSAAGLDAERFVFVGFLPSQSKARRELLATLAPLPLALVFYEAPHRVRATIGELATAFDSSRMLVVARELTKTFETITAMPLRDAPAWIAADANRERGELVLLVDMPAPTAAPATIEPDAARWLDALAKELPPARAARVVAELTGAPRDALYERAMAAKGRQRKG